MELLTEKNCLLYAMKHYDNPGCQTIEEFNEDYNKVKYIKRLLNRYINNNELKERLILNHIIVFLNVFGNEAGVRILFLKMNKETYSSLKTFLVFLNSMPDVLHGIDGKFIYSSDIQLDMNIANVLRRI